MCFNTCIKKLFLFISDFTPQEDVLPDSCGCDHWDNSHCNNNNTTQEIAVHQEGHIVILLIMYGFKT
jgi:hypothetical protein